jgi:mitochondrial fission protein ELM1
VAVSTPPRTLIVTNGAAGADAPAMGVALALGAAPAVKHVALPQPYRLLAPYGSAPKREIGRPPWPDLVIGVTRQAVPVMRAIKRASGGRAFTLFLQNPRTPLSWFDLVWAPAHDRLTGPNVIATPTAPHAMTPARLEEGAAAIAAQTAALPGPRIAVLIGGPNKAFKFTAADAQAMTQKLDALAPGGAFLVTTSRRTPADVKALIAFWAGTRPGLFWTGQGIAPLLGAADAIVVTADSINMVTEAVSTGKPVYIAELAGKPGKFALFHDALRQAGATRALTGAPFAPWTYPKVNANPVIAAAIAARLAAHAASFRQ